MTYDAAYWLVSILLAAFAIGVIVGTCVAQDRKG